jgi:hypothetical protein
MTAMGLQQGTRGRRVWVALVVAGLAGAGCGVVKDVKAIKKVIHNVEGNKATIDAFSSNISAGAATPFEATYATSGSTPATVVYAVQPPKDLSFTDTPSGGADVSANVHIVVNTAGEYLCTPSSSGSGTTCQKLGTADAASQNEILDFYTPAHWVGFLRDFALAAGIAGDKVSSSSMTVNGFTMKCVDFRASGVPGTSTICTTAQNILGYVKVAGDSTSFSITKYSASPASSLFQLPAGATVTTATS